MKNILGIIGSPRKLGNCEIMVKEISRQISTPHELKLLRLQDFKILPCSSNSGIMTLQDGAPVFEISKSDHELFLSKEEALKHREWLLGMKSRFVQQKKALKKITGSYIQQGSWIKP
jgi:hypothetical protein